VLIDHGYSACQRADNRPLQGEEFWEKATDDLRLGPPGTW